jgi:N-acetylmuramoyl-L-alanine amidase-like protein
LSYDSIVISSGHSTKCPGASSILDEVKEATKVVDRVADELEKRGVEVYVFHDTKSTTVSDNLDAIVSFHNDHERELDVSVHFNSTGEGVTERPVGTEVLWYTQEALAAEVSAAIARVGFIDRGPKYRDDLSFLKNTDEPSILIEICFIDSEADCEIYEQRFVDICEAIADVLGGEKGAERPIRPELPPPVDMVLFHTKGKVSHFGGPDDDGVASDEGLAFLFDVMDKPHLFLPYQPEGTTGLARRLNPHVHYVAARWDYGKTPKEMLAGDDVALVRNVKTGNALTAFPADWGPAENTDRVADISPGLMADLDLTTDDEVEVIYPYEDE